MNRLTTLRDARESQNAMPRGNKRSNQTPLDNVELAYRKFEESGELPGDFKTRAKVIDKIAEKEKGPNFNF
jgi:hypothetical protein